MDDVANYASFIIRIWRAPAQESQQDKPLWMGEVESIQSGVVLSFRGLEELAELLLGSLTTRATPEQ
jgi:hypothetical protein